jgi:hypothetical protein
MDYEGDQGADGFENMNFNKGNMGDMGANFTFKGNGINGMNPSQMF